MCDAVCVLFWVLVVLGYLIKNSQQNGHILHNCKLFSGALSLSLRKLVFFVQHLDEHVCLLLLLFFPWKT
jgi:hypothetical protein